MQGLGGGFDEVQGVGEVGLADVVVCCLEGEEEADVGVGELDGGELGEEGGAGGFVVAGLVRVGGMGGMK